jgi:hypothetical protein
VLYDVLTHESVQRRSPALVIAANKSDVRGAASPDTVRATLETELQRVRLARTTMQDISGRSSKAKGSLADPDGPNFSFDQLRPAVEVLPIDSIYLSLYLSIYLYLSISPLSLSLST